jgi:hypothetical protein
MPPSLLPSLLGLVVVPAVAAAFVVGCSGTEEQSATDEAALSSHELRRDRIAVAGAHPDPATSRCSYDSKQQNTVLFTGKTAAGAPGTTWTWNGVEWSERTGAGPSARSEFGLGFDEKRGVTVLFGGVAPSGEALDDLWEFDGTTWEAKAVTGGRPPAQANAQLAFDRTRNVLVLLGNASANAWEYDGTAWTQSAATIPAGAKVPSAMTDKNGQAFFLTWEATGYLHLKGWRYAGATFEPVMVPRYGGLSTRIYLETARQVMTQVSQYFIVDETGAILGDTAGTDKAPCFAYDAQRNRLVTYGPSAVAVEELWQAEAATEHAPTNPQLQDFSVFATEPLERWLAGSDAEDSRDQLRWSSANLPAGATLDPSGHFLWTPTASQAGVSQFNVTVTDTSGRTSTGAVRVTTRWAHYPQLPQGTVALTSPNVRLPVVNVDRLLNTAPANDEGSIRCTVAGTNPYKVTAKCTVTVGIVKFPDLPAETTVAENVIDESGNFRGGGTRVVRAHLVDNGGAPALVIDSMDWPDAAIMLDIRSRGPITLPLSPGS